MSYEEILSAARRLSRDEQMRLVASLTSRADEPSSPGGEEIMALQGLGKEIWEEVDAQAYIDRERDTWSG